MDKENFCFYIKVRTALNIQARIIYDELRSVFGDKAPVFRTVERWSKWFREGQRWASQRFSSHKSSQVIKKILKSSQVKS